MPRPLCVIVNPTSGQRMRLVTLRRVLGELEAGGWRVERHLTRGTLHAQRLAAHAAASGYEAVLVCGGDGTINEAVNGLVGTETALAVLPAGTTNVWAREVGIGT